MQLDPHALHIRTDGSCYRKQRMISGCAAIVEYPDHLGRDREQIVDFGCAESNVPRMELLAVIRALRWVRENRPWDEVTRVQIISDSTYVTDNIPRARGWRKNRWRNRYDEPMQNPDLWREFFAAFDKVGITVHIGWTLGKKSTVLKEIDKAAKCAAQRGGPNVDRGYVRGAISRSMVKDTAAGRFAARGQTAVIRPYRKDVMRRASGENKVRFNVFSEATESFVESSYAYATPAMAAELHRQNGYRVRFNDNPQYPQILEIIEAVPVPNQSKGPASEALRGPDAPAVEPVLPQSPD
jgi:ribonuclease HI